MSWDNAMAFLAATTPGLGGDAVAGSTFVYRVGPFDFDPVKRQLFRGAERVPLSDSDTAVLLHLIRHAGRTVSKEELEHAAWGNAAVSDAAVKQSIFRLRKLWKDAGEQQPLVDTVPNRGYTLEAAARAERIAPAGHSPGELTAYLALARGTADLATFTCTGVVRAIAAFEEVLQELPASAAAHVGLANAFGLAFDSTRFHSTCNLPALQRAAEHAEQAVTLAPGWSDAWSAGGFTIHLAGDSTTARAAALKAHDLDPADFRHAVRLAYVSWGDERLRAAAIALKIVPNLALAHWLRSTVWLARRAFEMAFAELRDGCEAQDAELTTPPAYAGIGMHLLRALALMAQQRLEEAEEALHRELAAVPRDHVYEQECAANTWYALGGLYLRTRRHDLVHAAFRRALDIAPGHVYSMAALGLPLPDADGNSPRRRLDVGLANAVTLACGGRHADAASAYLQAIATSACPAAGWILPVEPVLDALSRPAIWEPALHSVQRRTMLRA